jgi:hypothetical protein
LFFSIASIKKKVTTVKEHPRRLDSTYLDRKEIDKITKNYDLKRLISPKSGKLKIYSDSDKYDQLIAIWTDYFNHKFPSESLLIKILVLM